MTEEDLKRELTRLEPFEGRVPWMYLDNADEPNVTCGVGYLLASADEACRLPFHHVGDGLRATPDEIRADFFRVRSMRGGLRADAYKGDLRLAPKDIDAEGFRRLRVMLAMLPREFPRYADFPEGVQAALLDLRWNSGSLVKWRKLRAACNSIPPNWRVAAGECRTANPDNNVQREYRNDWRSQMFIDAAVAAGPTEGIRP